ncbi:MAG: hypothetical protein ACRD3W_20875, partial [Terriglobales bacterium]
MRDAAGTAALRPPALGTNVRVRVRPWERGHPARIGIKSSPPCAGGAGEDARAPKPLPLLGIRAQSVPAVLVSHS